MTDRVVDSRSGWWGDDMKVDIRSTALAQLNEIFSGAAWQEGLRTFVRYLREGHPLGVEG